MKYPKRSQYKHAKQKKYHVSNWAEYNEGLRRRGDLTVWFDEEAIANWKADKSGKPGGQRVYSEMAIETGLVVRMVYKLAYRQTEGFLHRVWDRLLYSFTLVVLLVWKFALSKEAWTKRWSASTFVTKRRRTNVWTS